MWNLPEFYIVTFSWNICSGYTQHIFVLQFAKVYGMCPVINCKAMDLLVVEQVEYKLYTPCSLV
jgi:hypothetical protein